MVNFVCVVIIWTAVLCGKVTLSSIFTEPKHTPYFGPNEVKHVITTVGRTAYLHCDVRELRDKEVSWIRQRDLHILTVGIHSYTTDERFQVIRHPEPLSNWTLQIRFPQLRDSGMYECQVNTQPKMSVLYKLDVVEARAKILGPQELLAKEGSSVTLTCETMQGPHELNTVFWYQNDKLIDVAEGDTSKRISFQNSWTNTLVSRLRIKKLNSTDSGKYSCAPTAAQPADISLFVITGEHPAAMHHGDRNSHSSAQINIKFQSLIFTLILWFIKN
ncbi:zwei Ig domain protein zig-8-like [Anthonomus grandis grandis]|uniref:zwei Ig domain protein zig-8-like n=1 Tax=Anthonomus grandis grandis TaxID=2921223 RepID=UPI002165B1F4|nr:zwei Ig domain protein zig-8-like [Anthonomus grandis grandis]